jgi:hypothetical protein
VSILWSIASTFGGAGRKEPLQLDVTEKLKNWDLEAFVEPPPCRSCVVQEREISAAACSAYAASATVIHVDFKNHCVLQRGLGTHSCSFR